MTDLNSLYSAASLPNLMQGSSQDYSIDKVIEGETKKLESAGAEILKFDLRFVEQNISDVGVLLDRVFSLRREINDVEAARIKAGLAYLYGLEAVEDDLTLEIAKAGQNRPEVEGSARRKAKHARNAILALEQRHGIDGGSLNYAQQRAKLEARLKLELSEAYARSLAVARGMAMFDDTLTKSDPFPIVAKRSYVSFDGARHLDDWLYWYRSIVIRLEQIQQRQIYVDATLSLGSIANYPAIEHSSTGNSPTIDHRVLVPNFRDLILGYKSMDFDLIYEQAGWPFSLDLGSRCLLRGVGLTIGIPNEHSKEWRYSAQIMMPGSDLPISFGSVPPFENGPDWVTDPIVYNQPVVGKWRISILPNPLRNADARDQARLTPNAWPLWDVQLYLRAAFF